MTPSAGKRSDIRFRILVPVWGEKYIDNFCEIALPALLADGNLPTLARYAECEVIFLTTGWSAPIFATRPGIAALNEVCPHSFLFIDDLFAIDTYGFILTIAYGRGIASMGERQLSTYFIFVNADFVFSDGLMATVVDRVERGFNAVIAPSLRANEEDVSDALRRRVDGERVRLSATPAELVRLTLDNLHPTVGASVVNRSEVQLLLGNPASGRSDALKRLDMHHGAANQFFWRVDDETLLGRFYLMFMLCIRPERSYAGPQGWCDYVLVPDLVPSGRYDVLEDSDDGFILEMQARTGEFEHLRMGRLEPADYAPRLSVWTTTHHRDYASRNVVLHAGALPPSLDVAKTEADAYMAELSAALSPAVHHLDHPYWVGSLAGLKQRIRPDVELPELGWTKLPPAAEAMIAALAEERGPARRGSLGARMAVAVVPALARLLSSDRRPGPNGVDDPAGGAGATVREQELSAAAARDLAERASRFDAAYYLRTNPDVAEAGIDPEAHFAGDGWRERRDPSPLFSTAGYLRTNPDVEAADKNPLEHFRDYGLAEGRGGWQK